MDNEKNINERIEILQNKLDKLYNLVDLFLIGYNEDLKFQGEIAEEILKLIERVKSLETTTAR